MNKRYFSFLLAFVICVLWAQGGIVSEPVSASYNPVTSCYEGSDGSFFYSFTESGHCPRLTLASYKGASFVRSAMGNDSGLLQIKQEANSGFISSGVKGIVMQADLKLKIRGDICYANYEKLVKSQCYIDVFLTGLAGLKLYNDPACTDYFGDAEGGFVNQRTAIDTSGTSFYDGNWHTFELVFEPVMLHSTGKYVDLRGASVNLWLRPFAGNSFGATTTYFKQSYLDECSAEGQTPYVDFLLDNFEGYFCTEEYRMEYYKDDTTMFCPFDEADSADTKLFVGSGGSRAHYAEYTDQNGVTKWGVVGQANPAGSVLTSFWRTKAAENKKMRIRGSIVLANASALNADNINVNALLIMNGGSTGDPTGFYEDEACTTPCASVSGNAIALTATMLSGIGDNGWVNFYHDFDTDTVLTSTIKRTAGDLAKTTVYIKPWEVARNEMWLRVSSGSPMNAEIKLGTTVFREAYLTECGYALSDGSWIADPSKSQTSPVIDWRMDSLSIYPVDGEEQSPDSFAPTNVQIRKSEKLVIGDSVNVTYRLENSTPEGSSKVCVLADGYPVAVGRAKGEFSFEITREMFSRNLTLMLTPAAGAFYGESVMVADFGIVGGGTHELYAEADENGVFHYRCDAFGEVEQSEVIAAMYDESRRLLAYHVIPIAASYGQERTVAEGTMANESASYATVYYWNGFSKLQPMEDMKLVHFLKDRARTAFYVDAACGNDRNDGTMERPLATIETARAMVRPYLADMQEDIHIYIKGGTYRLRQTVEFSAADSGQNGHNVIYSAWGDETPVISGGREYTNFTLYDADKNIYRTYVGEGTVARQIYINGIRAVRARSDVVRANYITDDGIDGPGALTNAVLDKENGIYTCDNTEYASFANQSDIEAVYYESWTNPRVKVQKIELNSAGKCEITMQSDSWRMASASSNCAVTYPMWFENAYELLNAEGEWYLNKTDGYLYYKPRAGEVPETMTATVPVLERAFTVSGSGTDHKIHNIKFEGLRFEAFTWLWPSTADNTYRDSQANQLLGYAGDGRLTGGIEDAAVIVADAAYVDFINCTFTKLGGAGINFREIYQNCSLIGNHIYDVSGSGMNIGCASVEAGNVTKFRNPTDEKYFRKENTIKNNLIHDVGIDYRSCVGIAVSWLKNSSITHNEIYNVNYSGMHIGWGWAAYADTGSATVGLDISYNYIHDTCNDYLCDSGGIYTLGATGGSAENRNQIRYNYFENMRGTPAAIYPDEGSTYWEIANNVVDLRECPRIINKRYRKGHELEWLVIHTSTIINNDIHDNYSTTAACRKFNEEDNTYEPAQVYADGNFPDEAKQIIQNAGLEPEYQEKFNGIPERLRVMNEKTQYTLAAGETVSMKVTAMGLKLTEIAIPKDQIHFYSTNEQVATVDQNGIVTAVGAGICNIRAAFLDGDIYKNTQIDIICQE